MKAKTLWVVTEGRLDDVELFTEKPTYQQGITPPYGGPLYDAWRTPKGANSVFQFCPQEFRKATGIRLKKNTPTRISVRVVGGK